MRYAWARLSHFTIGDCVPYRPEYRYRTAFQTLTRNTLQSTKFRERLLDSIPGILLILATSIGVVGVIKFPAPLLNISAVLAGYSILRFSLLAIAHLQGLKRIHETQSKEYGGFPDVQHVVIIPNYNEPMPVLRWTLQNLAECLGASDNLTVVLAMEASEPSVIDKALSLQDEFADSFQHIFYTIHPRNLPGEMQCKSSNQAWALRWVSRELVDKRGYDGDNVIITTMDADTLWHKHYFAELASDFSRNPSRHERIWQAPIRYHGNIYDVNPMLRHANVYSTAMELGYLSASWWESLPISSYSLSLRLLERCGYWETSVIADEWRMYINAYFATNGRARIQPIYLPFVVTAVTGTTFFDAVKNRYLQTVRHSWGSKEIGYTLGRLYDTGMWRGVGLLASVSHDLILGSTGAVMLTFGAQLTVLLHPELRTFSNPAFIVLQIVFLMTLLLGTIFLMLDIRARPPRPYPPTFKESVLTIIGFALLPVFGFLFVILPLLHAQILLLIGKPLTFQVTPKD